MNMPLLKSEATTALPTPAAMPAASAAVLRISPPKPNFASKLKPRLNAFAARVLPPLVMLVLILTVWQILCSRPGATLPSPTKIWGEALARHFADTTPLSMICLRIGRVTAADRPVGPRELSVWCSQRDIAQMVERCLVAPDSLRFDVFFVCSENKWTYRDIEHARAMVGFVPEDRAEDHRGRS